MGYPLKPVCVPCQRFFRPKRNGYYFIEGKPMEHGALPGRAQPELWEPYKVWIADLWECPTCHAEILSGFSHSPVTQDYMPEFDLVVRGTGAAQLQVNDC